MSCDPSAKVFYGLIKDLEEYAEGGPVDWGDAHEFKNDEGVSVEFFGSDGFLRYALAIEESVLKVEWNNSRLLQPQDFFYRDGWDNRLGEFARRKNLDISGSTPGWHLVSLYF